MKEFIDEKFAINLNERIRLGLFVH